MRKHQNQRFHCLRATYILRYLSDCCDYKDAKERLRNSRHTPEDLEVIDYIFQVRSFLANQSMSENTTYENSLTTLVVKLYELLLPGKTVSLQANREGITKELLWNLLAGVHGNGKDGFNEQEAWLHAEHFEIFRCLSYQDGYYYEDGSPKPFIASTSMFTFYRYNKDKTHSIQYLKTSMANVNKRPEHGFEVILIPAEIGDHWILFYVNLSRLTIWPINPYHPMEASARDLYFAEQLGNDLAKEFHLDNFTTEIPVVLQVVPVQNDTYNCGVYVISYMMAFLEPHLLENSPYFPFSTDQMRILLMAWFLTDSKPSIEARAL
jgi:hypothetical protein